MSSIKCFDLLPQRHARGAGPSPVWLDKSNFFPLTEKASYILLPLSQWKPPVKQEQFAPNWSAWSVLALVWSTALLASVKGCWRDLLVHLHAQTPFAKIGQGYLRRGLLCRNFVTPQVTMGQFGQIVVPHRKLQNLCRFR